MEYNKQQQTIIDTTDGNMIVVACAGSGKALDNNTGVLTPHGYVSIGTIKVGDTVFDGTGKPTEVIAVYPQGKKQVYEVEDSHGNIIRCCGEHLWKFQTKYQRDHKYGWNTKTTQEILDKFPLYIKSGAYSAKNIYLPIFDYVDFAPQELPIPPYTMGALIGDGSLRKSTHMFTNADEDVLKRVNQELSTVGMQLVHKDRYDYYIRKFNTDQENYYRNIIINLGLDQTLSDTKFIPPIYLYNSVENRLELLKGLIDTDGSCEGSAYEYITVSKQLADDVELLCQSLGYTVTRSTKECSYINDEGKRVKCKNAHRLRIKTNDAYPIITFCTRKTQKYKRGQTIARNCITKITPLDEYAEMTCITVASEEHTYIIEHGIVTHNTRSIVGTIHRYIKDHPDHHVTAITFTKKAAEELASRIGNNNVEVSTIHS